ncbi:hypothetical protein SH661x_000789 [Planctomicrobium sp. SH661]|uniref:hypothetical protein n=1 Tax=Planctomicrobium sp. SH661 TaxID=3448124 RepID=UPI003F5B8D69
MLSKNVALLIGGLIPALVLGFAGIFQKLASPHLGTGPFLIVTGLTTCIVGSVFLILEKDASCDLKSAGLAFLYGVSWASAVGMISISLRKLGGSMSQLAPLYNMNTLIAVLAGLVLLAEWKTVNPPRIILASLFIIVGGLLAAKS